MTVFEKTILTLVGVILVLGIATLAYQSSTCAGQMVRGVIWFVCVE